MILARTSSVSPDIDGKHWSLQLAQEQDVIHTDAYAQDPTRFQRTTTIGRRIGRPYPWRPGVATWGSGDAMFPNGNSFSLGLDTTSYPALLSIGGVQPVNGPSSLFPPITPLQATTNSTGGSIPPGNYLVVMSCNGNVGPVSKSIKVNVPAGTSTNTITVSGVQWRNGAEASPAPYIGTSMWAMVLAAGSTYSTSVNDTNGNPTTFTFTALTVDGLGLPDSNAQEFLVEQTTIWHNGVFGDVIASVSGAGLVLGFNVPGSGFGTGGSGQFAGYVLSLIYRPGLAAGAAQPAINLSVTSNTSSALTMGAAGFLVGDVVVMRQKTGHVSANTFGDDNWNNCYAVAQYGSPGLATNAEFGRLAMVISGTGAGQPPISIDSNTHTVFTLSRNWYVQPDSTSVIIVIDSTVEYAYYTNTFANSSSSSPVPIFKTTANTNGFQVLLIQVATADANGNTASMRYQPFREVYVPPQQLANGQVITTTPYNVNVTDSVLTFAGSASVVNLPAQSLFAVRHELVMINTTSSTMTINVASGSGDDFEGASSLQLFAGQRIRVVPNS